MEQQQFMEIELTRIGRCPWQPRRHFDPDRMAELVKSIEQKGVLEPILVRPISEPYRQEGEFPTAGNLVDHQLVAGERRFRAACAVAFAQGGGIDARIPAMVRELTDEEAFDVMTVENLQREDLSPLEEAESFRAYVERHGTAAVEDLAERVGVSAKYIRRRLQLMVLPERVLEAWGKGEIGYGYLEQLARLRSPQAIEKLFDEIMEEQGAFGEIMSVKDLKAEIDRMAPSLKSALFHTKSIGCGKCPQNSEIQRRELGIDQELKGAHCLDPECFRQKTAAFLRETWAQGDLRAAHKTNGFRFRDEFEYGQFEMWYGKEKPSKECLGCQSFVSLVDVDGSLHYPKVCIGEKGCFRSRKTQQAQGEEPGGAPGKRQEAAPRAAWHGNYFRDQFYREQIVSRAAELTPGHPEWDRLTLIAMVHAAPRLCRILFKKKTPWESDDRIAQAAIALTSRDEVMAMLGDMTRELLSAPDFGGKKEVAEYLGADLARDYRLTQEYLEKKTVAEIHALAQEFGLWKRSSAQVYLTDVLKKKPGQFHTCRKEELVRLILDSGMDLSGVVPKEILGKGK